MAALGCPADVFQVLENPSIPMAQELMRQADLTIATGGPAMVRAAYSSGKPAYGVGAGKAVAILKKQGFEKAMQLMGGVAAWQAANLPVEKSA